MLKLIAALTMLIDHIGMVLFPQYSIFRIIGRIAMPLFAFSVSQGFYYTHQRARSFKYLRDLLVFSLLSQGPYQYMLYVVGISRFTLNIGFTWTFSLMILLAVDDLSGHNLRQQIRGVLLFLIGVAIPGFVAVDYGFFGIVLPLIIYLLFFNNRWLLVTGANGNKSLVKPGLISYVIFLLFFAVMNLLFYATGGSVLQNYSLLVILFIPLNFMPTLAVKIPKKFFYIFYPLHILLLTIIRLIYW